MPWQPMHIDTFVTGVLRVADRRQASAAAAGPAIAQDANTASTETVRVIEIRNFIMALVWLNTKGELLLQDTG